MSELKRGDRVQYKVQKNNPLSGKQGTITHLHGDPGYDANRDEVWVQFDDHTPGWVPMHLLVKLS